LQDHEIAVKFNVTETPQNIVSWCGVVDVVRGVYVVMMVLYCNYSSKETNKLVACSVVCANSRRDNSKELDKPCRKCASRRNRTNDSVKGKGKFHPRTGHEGPKREQMYSSTLPSTSALDGGRRSTPGPGRFTPKSWFPLYRRLGGAHRRSEQMRKISPPQGFDPPLFSWRLLSDANRISMTNTCCVYTVLRYS
jgi:hypothetical protein